VYQQNYSKAEFYETVERVGFKTVHNYIEFGGDLDEIQKFIRLCSLL